MSRFLDAVIWTVLLVLGAVLIGIICAAAQLAPYVLGAVS